MILVHRSMSKLSIVDKKVDIVLTPQDYILKKEALPIKYEYQAKKIAMSIFDDILDDGVYSFFVYKYQEEWIFIAYNIDNIINLLKEKGLSDKVRYIYFIQQFIDSIDTPIRLDDLQAIVSLDKTMTIVPITTLNNAQIVDFDLQNIKIPKKHITLKQEKQNIDNKILWIFSLIFIVFSMIYLYQGYRYQNVSDMDEKLNTLISKYPNLQSSYARDNLLKKYKLIDLQERKKRNIIKNISLLLKQKAQIDELRIKNDIYMVRLNIKNVRNITNFKKKILDKQMKIKEDTKDYITIEGKL